MADASGEVCYAEVRRSGSGRKRVVAPPPVPAGAPPGAPPRWLQRELQGAQASQREERWRSFSHFTLQHERDLYGKQASSCWWPPFHLRRRSAAREVVAAGGIVFGMADSGICTAYCEDTGALLCFLNVAADESIRSLFVDHAGDAILTVSLFSGDALQRLRVRATPLAAIRRRRPLAWRPLFGSEVLSFPGFVEFDDVNGMICTCSADSRTFKVWDLQAPLQPRFYVDGQGVADVKIASGALLLVMKPPAQRGGTDGAKLHVRVLDLQDGSCAKELHLPLSSRVDGPGDIEVVELFGQWLLTKEPGGPLRITDIVSGAAREVAGLSSPAAFIHLPFNHTFLAFWQTGDAQLWSFRGELLARLQGVAMPSAASANTVYVTTPQDLMFAFCPPSNSSSGHSDGGDSAAGPATSDEAASPTAGSADSAGGAAAAELEGAAGGSPSPGCIRVFDLLTGRQVAAVQQQPWPPDTSASKRAARRAAAAAAALAHVTAVFYDERRHRLYTGSADGKLQVWGL